mgnify:CR=1 FL=1
MSKPYNISYCILCGDLYCMDCCDIDSAVFCSVKCLDDYEKREDEIHK